MTIEEALKISESRTYEFIRKNAVFARPHGFQFCMTNDPENGELIISMDPVKTFLCVYSKKHRFWMGQYLGLFDAIFSKDGSHFPGYLYYSLDFDSQPNMKIFA